MSIALPNDLQPVPFELIRQSVGFCKLSDGNYLKTEVVITRIHKSQSLRNQDGSPICVVNSHTIHTYITEAEYKVFEKGVER